MSNLYKRTQVHNYDWEIQDQYGAGTTATFVWSMQDDQSERWIISRDKPTNTGGFATKQSARRIQGARTMTIAQHCQSILTEDIKPFQVRASCGHVVIRKMRESTAGVTYAPDIVIDAPRGRACPACETKELGQ